MTTYFYIHGFNSSKNSDTVQKLRKYFPNIVPLTYDYKNPEKSIKDLTSEINSYSGELTIISSSLGGWYAEQLTKYVGADYIFFNPATEPYKTLFYDFGKQLADIYKRLSDYSFIRVCRRVVVLGTNDQVINYKTTDIKYTNAARVIKIEGGHRMTDESIQLIIELIKEMDNRVC